MKAGDALILAAAVAAVTIVNFTAQLVFARWLVGQGAMRALLIRGLTLAFFMAVAAGILVLWASHRADQTA